MVVDLFFKESRQFKLDVTLKAIVSSDLVVLALTDFGTEWNIIHGQDHLQETRQYTTKSNSVRQCFAQISFHFFHTRACYLLLIVKEAVLVLVEVGEHMEALGFADVVHHVVLEKLIDVIGADLA